MKNKPVDKYLKVSIFVFLTSLIFSLGMLELFLRIAPQGIAKIDYSIINDERLYSPTKFVKFKPNFTRVWTGLGPPTVWHFNNLGFRERAIFVNKPQNIFRIVVIGDSIVMGFGVEDFEAFPRQLELKLKARVFSPGISHLEVLNLGIQGYSSPQYLAVLKEDAINLKPDLVIITVYPSNDLTGAVSFWKNKKYTNLMAVPDIVPFPINEFFKKHSRLYLFLLTKYYTFSQRYESNFKPSQEHEEEGWGILRKDLESVRLIMENNNLKVVLLPVPRPKEVLEESSSYDLARFDALAEDLGFNYYDPFNDLKKYKNIRELYLENLDDHFSIKGNEYLASLLSKFLIEKRLVPKQP